MSRILWIAYVVLAGLLVGVQIFWPPPVGLANNGDFSKVTGYYNLGDPNGARDEYERFVTEYRFSPQYDWGSRIVTSEHVFAWPTVHTSRALISRDQFDIRILGLFHLLALLLAFGIAGFVVTRLTPIPASCLAIFTLFIFTEVAYSSSLNSFYTDTATMLFALLTIVIAVICTTAYCTRTWMIYLVIAGMLLITSKMQHAFLGLPLCLLSIACAVHSSKKIRVDWLLITAVWLATIVLMTRGSDPLYKATPLFTTIFFKIGGSSTDPETDFRELGLGPEYLPLRGLFAYSPGSPLVDVKWCNKFLNETSFGKVFLFYVRHPLRAAGFVWQDVEKYGGSNPDTGLLKYPPQKLSFSTWHNRRNYLFQRYPAHIIGVFALSLGFCAACCASAAMRARYPAWLCFLAVTLMAMIALAVATLADAADTARHLYIFHVLTDVMLCFWCWLISSLVPAFQAIKLPAVKHANAMQGISQQ